MHPLLGLAFKLEVLNHIFFELDFRALHHSKSGIKLEEHGVFMLLVLFYLYASGTH